MWLVSLALCYKTAILNMASCNRFGANPQRNHFGWSWQIPVVPLEYMYHHFPHKIENMLKGIDAWRHITRHYSKVTSFLAFPPVITLFLQSFPGIPESRVLYSSVWRIVWFSLAIKVNWTKQSNCWLWALGFFPTSFLCTKSFASFPCDFTTYNERHKPSKSLLTLWAWCATNFKWK